MASMVELSGAAETLSIAGGGGGAVAAEAFAVVLQHVLATAQKPFAFEPEGAYVIHEEIHSVFPDARGPPQDVMRVFATYESVYAEMKRLAPRSRKLKKAPEDFGGRDLEFGGLMSWGEAYPPTQPTT